MDYVRDEIADLWCFRRALVEFRCLEIKEEVIGSHEPASRTMLERYSSSFL
jgi:hypothetical protein